MKRLMILVVEDNDDSRALYDLVLSRAGFEVKGAGDSEAALEMLDDLQPDLLITDIHMPNLSGIDLIRHIRADEKWVSLPIIAVTAFGPDQLALAATQGATRVLRKPFEPNRLLSIVFELTKKVRARSTGYHDPGLKFGSDG
ncbi:MAG: Chemotaxis protein CheY [Acidobacteria bacterium]|nr:Chemotaxis protein CheY [Acidobacteriota bacterium]